MDEQKIMIHEALKRATSKEKPECKYCANWEDDDIVCLCQTGCDFFKS